MTPSRRKLHTPSSGDASARASVTTPTLPCRLVKCCLPLRFCKVTECKRWAGGVSNISGEGRGTKITAVRTRAGCSGASALQKQQGARLVVVNRVEAQGGAGGGGGLHQRVAGDRLHPRRACGARGGADSGGAWASAGHGRHRCPSSERPRAATQARRPPSLGRKRTAVRMPSDIKPMKPTVSMIGCQGNSWPWCKVERGHRRRCTQVMMQAGCWESAGRPKAAGRKLWNQAPATAGGHPNKVPARCRPGTPRAAWPAQWPRTAPR